MISVRKTIAYSKATKETGPKKTPVGFKKHMFLVYCIMYIGNNWRSCFYMFLCVRPKMLGNDRIWRISSKWVGKHPTTECIIYTYIYITIPNLIDIQLYHYCIPYVTSHPYKTKYIWYTCPHPLTVDVMHPPCWSATNQDLRPLFLGLLQLEKSQRASVRLLHVGANKQLAANNTGGKRMSFWKREHMGGLGFYGQVLNLLLLFWVGKCSYLILERWWFVVLFIWILKEVIRFWWGLKGPVCPGRFWLSWV